MSDDLKPIGDLLPKIVGSAALKKARGKAWTEAREKDHLAAEKFKQQEYGMETLAYMPSQLVQCCFPHDDPGEENPAWSRSTPWLTVTFQPGYKRDRKTGQPVCIGYPFGTVPRLLMFYVMTQIEHTKNRADLTSEEKRTIYLGDSLGEFMRNIGLNPDNGSGKRSDRKRLINQVERFMRVKVSMDAPHENDDGYAFSDMLIAEDGDFWWTAKHDDQADLFKSYIVLSEKFYRRVLNNLVPLDMAALRALKNSALHLDLYAWCLWRGYTISNGKNAPTVIEWRSFMMQSGANYKYIRQFKSRVIDELDSVRPYLKHLRVETSRKGITIHPTRLAVVSRREA